MPVLAHSQWLSDNRTPESGRLSLWMELWSSQSQPCFCLYLGNLISLHYPMTPKNECKSYLFVWKEHGTRLARPSFITVGSVMVVSSAFLWLIPSGQSMSLFKMEKRVHHASKVSSKICPLGLMYRNSVVCQNSRRCFHCQISPPCSRTQPCSSIMAFVQCSVHLSNRS